MDKYEFNIKLDQIKKLAGKKDFKTAAKIAKAMDWRKIKDWATLSLIINIQEASGDYEEAKDTAILAYNRNLGGRRLVYKLTELFIKLGEFRDAEDLYKEYSRMSQHDVNKFVLLYKLRKAQDVPIERLIEILEEYKDHEIDEKYLCELAELYSKAGRVEDCLKECEEIALWFQEGRFVEKALRIKQQYAKLTTSQQQILDNAGKKIEIDAEKMKELEFAKAKEQARLLEDEIEEVFSENSKETESLEDDLDEELDDSYGAEGVPAIDKELSGGPSVDLVQNNAAFGNVQNALKSFIKRALGTEEEIIEEDNLDKYDEYQEQEDFLPTDDSANTETATLQDFESDAVFTDVSAEQSFESQISASTDYAKKFNTRDITGEIAAGAMVAKTLTSVADDAVAGGTDFATKSVDSAANIARAGETIRELIENAKKKIENDYEQVRREDAAEKLQDEVCNKEVPVANYNLYDTQNIQAEIAKNLNQLMIENPEEDLFRSTSFMQPESGYEADAAAAGTAEHTADGTLAGAVAGVSAVVAGASAVVAGAAVSGVEAEAVIEDEQIEGQMSLGDWIEAIQEEKYGKQNTKEFSKAELERMLEERENEKAEYEKLLAKMKQQAEDKGEKFDEEEARRNAEQQVILQSVKTDLAIRTGKATAKIEAEVDNIREAAKLTAMIEERAAKEAERIENEARLEAELAASRVVVHHNVFRDIFNEDEEDEEDVFDESQKTEEPVEEAGPSVEPQPEVNGYEESGLEEVSDEDAQEEQEAYDDMISDFDPDQTDETGSEIPENVRKYFRKYNEMPGLESQLAQYFASSKQYVMSNTSARGNIIISGNRSSDKTNLAISIIKALNTMYPENPRKIAKTTGESINHKGIAKAISKLKGTALIVEDAGVIEPKRIAEMLEVMEKNTEGMIVIFEDSDTEINVLLSINPSIAEKFNYRIVLKQYTVNELVEMAKKYAGKRQHAIDDNALLQLYLRIDRLHSQVDCVHLDQIKEIIDTAILKAEKRSTRKLFGGIKKKRNEKGDVFFLMEADFKD